MKLLMGFGGMLGFLMGIAFGVACQSDWSSMIWRASAGALIAGWLMRWWGKLWITGLQQARRERLSAARLAASSGAATKL
jgi:hypothetical protein